MTAQKTILITGATSGIGRDTAEYLHSRGHRVIATGRNETALAALEASGLIARRLDVTDEESIDALAREIEELTDGKGLDALVNNAGYGLFGPLEILSDKDVRAQFDTNVFGLLAVTRRFIPAMRERGAGRIVNISSVGGRITFPLGGAYHATKYALEAMSDALRMELKQFGIDVVLVEPGYIKTNFTSTTLSLLDPYESDDSPYAASFALTQGIEEKLAKVGAEPRVVSKAITRAIEARRPSARYVAPGINVLGVWSRFFLPTGLVDRFFRRIFGLRRPVALPARATA
jgi:NAD(P)-dependent dehydrogenase (short-subunit alcohol dehydrogenase family)